MSELANSAKQLSMGETDSPEFLYLRLKSSISQYGVNWSQLDATQQRHCSDMAKRAFQLQQLVCRSSEAILVMVNDSEVTAAIEQLKGRYQSTIDFSHALTEHGLNTSTLATALRTEMRCEATLTRVGQQAPELSESEALDYYEQNIQKFIQPERRKASHLLITVNDQFSENRRPQVQQKIMALAGQISPETFSDLALRHSECPTAMHGGELGLVKKGLLYAELEQTLFDLPAGTISAPVETEAGFHLVFCQQILPAHTVSFEDAKQQIIEKHHQRLSAQRQKQWVRELQVRQLAVSD